MREYEFSDRVKLNKKDALHIIMDIKNYNKWNNCLHYESGELKVGEKLILKASLDGKKFIKWSCYVKEIKNDRIILSKSLLFKAYMHMNHNFIVIHISENESIVKHKWTGTGFATIFFWNKIIKVLDKFKPYNTSLIKYINK